MGRRKLDLRNQCKTYWSLLSLFIVSPIELLANMKEWQPDPSARSSIITAAIIINVACALFLLCADRICYKKEDKVKPLTGTDRCCCCLCIYSDKWSDIETWGCDRYICVFLIA